MSARGADRKRALHLPGSLLVVVAAQDDIGAGGEQSTLSRPPIGQAHPPRDSARQYVVVEHQHPGEPGGCLLEDLGHSVSLRPGQMALHRNVANVQGQGPEGDPVAAERADNDRAWDLELRREVSEVLGVLGVLAGLAQHPQRALPPFDVMIAGNQEGRQVGSDPIEKRVRSLELAVAGPLAHVARDDRGRGAKGGNEILQRLDLVEIGISAEVDIGNVGDDDRLIGHARSQPLGLTRQSSGDR